VLHPALETDPGHAIWKRDFTGASACSASFSSQRAEIRRCLARHLKIVWHGLIHGVVSKPGHSLRLRDLSHGLDLGAGGPTLRLHIGLENVEESQG